MNSKQIGSLFVGVLALVFVMSVVSADIVFSPNSTSQTITSGQTSVVVNFNLVHTGVGGNYTGLTWTGSSTTGTLTLPTSQTTLNTSQSIPLTATLAGISPTFTGTITGNITVTASGGTPTEDLPFTVVVNAQTVPTEISTCTTTGNPGVLSVKRISFTNNGLSGTSPETFGKDDEWFPRENVDVEIQIKNNGNTNGDRVNNIEVNWGLYNTQTSEWVIEPVDEKDFDLKDGKTETLVVSFNLENDLDVDLSDLTDGADYKFYVTAAGDVDDGNDTATCVSDFEPASVVIESDFVVLDNIQIPEVVQCGQVVEVSADVWNVGDNDQDEVSVDIVGRENALGLSDDVQMGDVDAFDSKPFLYSFTVPKNLEERTYGLIFQVKDDNGDVFQNSFNDDYSEFVMPLMVKGNCAAGSTTSVAANLVSGGKAGQDLVVKATITNTDTVLKTLTISAAGFSEWASSVSADQNTLVLSPGQSRDVLFTLDVNKGVSGEQTFFIEATSGSEVTRQPVLVNIAPSSAFGALGNVFSGGNWTIWAIGLLNLILVIVIIVVAVRVSRKK